MSFFGYQLEYIWVLGLVILIVPAYVWLSFIIRQRAVIPYPPVQYQSGRRLPKIFFIFTTLMEILLLLVLILSLAKPYKSSEITMIQQEGIDIMLTMDISSSMQAKDYQPNRLEAAKKILKEFVRRSTGDRIGIVVFAAHVFVLSPMTTDHLVLQHLLDGLSLDSIDHFRSGGTAIGDGILRSAEILKEHKIPKRDQVMILMSDGDNEQGVDTAIATKYAYQDVGIRIHAIGVGSPNSIEVFPRPTTMPEWHFFSKLNEETLKSVAAAAGGQYFSAATNDALTQVFQQISLLEKTPIDTNKVYQRRYLRYPLNFLAGILFVVIIIMRVIFIRRPLK